jgi:hypothetical protein
MNEVAGPFVERQLQLLNEGGHFGNIHAQTLIYKGAAKPVRNVMLDSLVDARMAAFGHRPATVFPGANPRAGITTGKKDTFENNDEDADRTEKFTSSELLLFYPEERDLVFGNIGYSPIEGLILGDYIGDRETNDAFPKVGTEMSRSILLTLRDNQPRQFDDVITRDEESDHVVWRSYHPLYWTNPFLEDLYSQHPSDDVSPSRDFEPMYYENELERRAGFLILQSSAFYHYWTVYENQRDLNWGPIEAFPFPKQEDLESVEDKIVDLSEEMWETMQNQFNGRGISNGAAVKPISDQVDEVIGPMLGLSDEQIEWVKNYHTNYGRQMENEQLDV